MVNPVHTQVSGQNPSAPRPLWGSGAEHSLTPWSAPCALTSPWHTRELSHTHTCSHCQRHVQLKATNQHIDWETAVSPPAATKGPWVRHSTRQEDTLASPSLSSSHKVTSHSAGLRINLQETKVAPIKIWGFCKCSPKPMLGISVRTCVWDIMGT